MGVWHMSRIEQLIGEIEEYIDSCKYQPLSNTRILVNKEEMEELLVELRLRIPEEIKKYQKIISQQEAILTDAKNQAENILKDAQSQTAEMVSENQIMQQAQQKANELVQQARNTADGIINNAIIEANNIRSSAIRYTDEMLASLETIIRRGMDESRSHFDEMSGSLQNTFKIITSNRAELQQAFQNVQETETSDYADLPQNQE